MKTFKEHRELVEVGYRGKKGEVIKNKDLLHSTKEFEIAYDSSFARNQKAKFKVGRKTKVSGGKIEKITLQRIGKDGKAGGVKHFLYNRGGNVSFAIGDLAATLTDIK